MKPRKGEAKLFGKNDTYFSLAGYFFYQTNLNL